MVKQQAVVVVVVVVDAMIRCPQNDDEANASEESIISSETNKTKQQLLMIESKIGFIFISERCNMMVGIYRTVESKIRDSFNESTIVNQRPEKPQIFHLL
jgi:hypothetical protein